MNGYDQEADDPLERPGRPARPQRASRPATASTAPPRSDASGGSSSEGATTPRRSLRLPGVAGRRTFLCRTLDGSSPARAGACLTDRVRTRTADSVLKLPESTGACCNGRGPPARRGREDRPEPRLEGRSSRGRKHSAAPLGRAWARSRAAARPLPGHCVSLPYPRGPQGETQWRPRDRLTRAGRSGGRAHPVGDLAHPWWRAEAGAHRAASGRASQGHRGGRARSARTRAIVTDPRRLWPRGSDTRDEQPRPHPSPRARLSRCAGAGASGSSRASTACTAGAARQARIVGPVGAASAPYQVACAGPASGHERHSGRRGDADGRPGGAARPPGGRAANPRAARPIRGPCARWPGNVRARQCSLRTRFVTPRSTIAFGSTRPSGSWPWPR